MVLVDVHAHNFIEGKSFLDSTKVITIQNGLDSKTNQQCLGLLDKFKTVRVAMGWHPTEVKTEDDYIKSKSELNFIRNNSDKIVAIGEIGLDYFHTKDEVIKILQKKTFLDYLSLANELDLPVIIHARNSANDVISILENELNSGFHQKIILHCFEASSKNIKKAISLGCYFTIPASVKRNELFQRLVELVPINKLLTETDAPFQGPIKGVPAKPEDVFVALEYIAEIKGLDIIEVENLIYMNYMRVFL